MKYWQVSSTKTKGRESPGSIYPCLLTAMGSSQLLVGAYGAYIYSQRDAFLTNGMFLFRSMNGPVQWVTFSIFIFFITLACSAMFFGVRSKVVLRTVFYGSILPLVIGAIVLRYRYHEFQGVYFDSSSGDSSQVRWIVNVLGELFSGVDVFINGALQTVGLQLVVVILMGHYHWRGKWMLKVVAAGMTIGLLLTIAVVLGCRPLNDTRLNGLYEFVCERGFVPYLISCFGVTVVFIAVNACRKLACRAWMVRWLVLMALMTIVLGLVGTGFLFEGIWAGFSDRIGAASLAGQANVAFAFTVNHQAEWGYDSLKCSLVVAGILVLLAGWIVRRPKAVHSVS